MVYLHSGRCISTWPVGCLSQSHMEARAGLGPRNSASSTRVVPLDYSFSLASGKIIPTKKENRILSKCSFIKSRMLQLCWPWEGLIFLVPYILATNCSCTMTGRKADSQPFLHYVSIVLCLENTASLFKKLHNELFYFKVYFLYGPQMEVRYGLLTHYFYISWRWKICIM